MSVLASHLFFKPIFGTLKVDTLQQTVSQRAQMFEALSGTEREQHAQYQLLKETLDSVTQELSHKHAQVSNPPC